MLDRGYLISYLNLASKDYTNTAQAKDRASSSVKHFFGILDS